MALINCKECKKEISSSADRCPNCGVKNPANHIGCGASFLVIVLVLILIGLFATRSNNIPSNKTAESIETTEPTDSIATIQPPPIAPNKWQYETSTDDVSGKEISAAFLISNNSFELDFPYNGGTTSFITIRHHPRYGQDVIVQVNKGQLNCQYDNCYISVRFDDGNVQKYNVGKPADHSSEYFFISNKTRFLKNALLSKKMFVELTFYQQGSKTFEFNTENLDLTKVKKGN